MTTAREEGNSLGKRYIFKLFSNVATVPLYLVLEAVLPRALGPAMYGNYNFATSLFQNFANFLDMGTSTCLFTAVAKRPGEFGLLSFYARVALAMLLLCLLAGLCMFLPGAGEFLLPGIPLWMAVPAALWAYFTWASKTMRGISDALGFTIHSEFVRVGVNLFSASALLALFYSGILTLPVLFGHQYLTLGAMAVGYALCLRGVWRSAETPETSRSWRLSRECLTGYLHEFRRYSTPLFFTALCSVLALSGERWMLQTFDGSEQQGFFSLSQKVGTACFLFVSAMTPLLTRELAVAHGKGDPQGMARILDTLAPSLYAVSAWLACFTLIEAQTVVRLFGGDQFAVALLPVQIMTLYPLHQGYGQIAGAVFYASGETRLYRNISIAGLLMGLLCAWILLAPPASGKAGESALLVGGFGLGAAGLAWKMVGVQFVTVNILLLACRSIAPFRYWRNFAHQLLCPAALLLAAAAARHGTEALLPEMGFFRFLVSGMCYCAFCLILACVFPFLFGLSRDFLRKKFSLLFTR